ncbi:MAG: twin-arginine translocation signal domain-containing protein [Phycicoccus sp.]
MTRLRPEPHPQQRSGGLDRRRFLRLTGVGGAGLALGVAGVGPLAGAAHAAAIDAITLGNRILSAKPDRADWDQWCQAAQYWAVKVARGGEPASYDSAIIAYRASPIASTDLAAAPAGTFSYWDIGTYGHVVTNIGNGYCINTSRHTGTVVDFGRGLRITRTAEYGPASGARYLGWSYYNGANGQIDMVPWSPGGGGGGQTWAFNEPDAAMQKRIQTALKKRGRYGGLEDGDWGVESIKGIQTTIKNVGYEGDVDGEPGPNTCHYVQVYAERFGDYEGPIDSVLGPNSWANFALGLERP